MSSRFLDEPLTLHSIEGELFVRLNAGQCHEVVAAAPRDLSLFEVDGFEDSPAVRLELQAFGAGPSATNDPRGISQKSAEDDALLTDFDLSGSSVNTPCDEMSRPSRCPLTACEPPG